MSDKVKMSVSCVKCGKHAVDWRDTLEQKHWKDLDERPLCPDCVREEAERDQYHTDAERMVEHLRDMRISLSLMLAHKLPETEPMKDDPAISFTVRAFTAVNEAYDAVECLAAQFELQKNTRGMIIPNF